jgi:2-C-methyl-D-erythritol 2,4-cyclodiphosphate synthase
MITRTGIGYDIHRFSDSRELWLGGVKIESEVGLEGHSDADVLLHAIADALLGAGGLGDIGRHFLDTDPQWKNIRSTVLLKKVCDMLAVRSGEIVNIDATIIMERPKIAPYVLEMEKTIASVAAIDPSQVNVKATTNETLGALGKGEGAAAFAVAAVQFR